MDVPLTPARRAEIARKTAETDIRVAIDLDGTGRAAVATGVGFLDHMLTALSRHSMIDMDIAATGDLHIDFHHTAEDVGIVIGQALRKALGDKRGIRRYGAALLPMDEALAECAIDISGRPFLAWSVPFARDKVGEMDTELFEHWFHSIAHALGITLHIELLYGQNNHHIVEGIYKGFARAMRQAVERDPRKGDAVPSTKGQLGG